LDLVFVATGLLHDDQISPEKTLKSVTAEALEHAFRINTVGPALIGKHALPRLRKDAKAIFAALSARVGSISDNRLGGWHSYRASKAALNMIIRNFAIELGRTRPAAICVGLHPGTVDTALSKPFQANVPASRLLSPTESASALLSVLENANSDQTGSLFAWDGQLIDF
jgi:NAD(P)-dependent dehydrogenase (short-subunit alcohol dehydrogenase family)